jgi:integrase
MALSDWLSANPSVHRKQKRHAICMAAEHSFKSAYLLWLEHRKLELKVGRQSTLSQIQRIFENDVLPCMDTFIFDIQRSDLLAMLTRIEARGALSIAEKARTWFNQLFRFALVKISTLILNPASDLNFVALLKPPVANNPFLRLLELLNLLRKLRAYRFAIMPELQQRIRNLVLTER